MEFNPLIPVGTKIKVNKSKIENLIPEKLMNELPEMINGEITDYKMTDGMGIGYVLMTENNHKIWIFSTELDDKTKIEYKIDYTNNSKTRKAKENILESYKVNYEINSNKNIKTIINPINLISWLIFTLKDIF